MQSISFKNAGPKRRYDDLSANELRMKLELAGIPYCDNASKKELIALVRKNKL